MLKKGDAELGIAAELDETWERLIAGRCSAGIFGSC